MHRMRKRDAASLEFKGPKRKRWRYNMQPESKQINRKERMSVKKEKEKKKKLTASGARGNLIYC